MSMRKISYCFRLAIALTGLLLGWGSIPGVCIVRTVSCSKVPARIETSPSTKCPPVPISKNVFVSSVAIDGQVCPSIDKVIGVQFVNGLWPINSPIGTLTLAEVIRRHIPHIVNWMGSRVIKLNPVGIFIYDCSALQNYFSSSGFPVVENSDIFYEWRSHGWGGKFTDYSIHPSTLIDSEITMTISPHEKGHDCVENSGDNAKALKQSKPPWFALMIGIAGAFAVVVGWVRIHDYKRSSLWFWIFLFAVFSLGHSLFVILPWSLTIK